MSKMWTIISVDRESGATKNRMMITGFDTHVAEGEFKKEYPNEDMLALISGNAHVSVYDVPNHNDPSNTKPES
jgi:hypothetical protein